MGFLFSKNEENKENNDNKENKEKEAKQDIIIDLNITDGTQNSKRYKCDTKEPLKKYIKRFTDEFKLNYSSSVVLYDGKSLFGEELKKSISKIINKHDMNDKTMALLLYENSAFDKHAQDEIKIILVVQQLKINELKGIKGQTIEDIIREDSKIKINLKWCIFIYEGNEIDINKKFDEIANEKDKKNSQIIITLNYTIPLIVNYFNKEIKNSTTIKCGFKDRVDNYFNKINIYLREKDYYFTYENKKVKKSNTFYEIISEDKIQNFITNENNNPNITTINNFTSIENLDKTNKIMDIGKEKEKIGPKTMFPSNDKDDRKLVIEMKVIKKCFCVRHRKKIIRITSIILLIILFFYVYGRWIIFLHV